MTMTQPTADRSPNRRNFLYAATAAVGVVGIGAAVWPLIDQMNPDARMRAAGDVVAVDLAGLAAGQQRVVHWHQYPIFVARRTEAMLAAMQQAPFVATLADADSLKRQQPTYARNWHRSIDPAYAVLVGICTACNCVPAYYAEGSVLAMAGGYQCPCCASHYDPAGRAYSGLASYNLPVPPYVIAAPGKLLIGKNAGDEIYSLDAVERI